MNRKWTGKPYQEMTAAELARATAEFDEEFVIDRCTPLTPEERARWQRAKRKGRGRQQDAGRRVIAIRVEEEVLDRADALAKQLGISRDDLVTRGLRAVLAAAGKI